MSGSDDVSVDVDDVSVEVVVQVLREVGPHGVRDHPATRGLDVFSYFEGRDLRRQDLTGIGQALSVSFRRSDLRQADLRGIHLHGADLREADLRGADARGARLTADLRRARFDGLVLDGAELTQCQFAGAMPDIARCAKVVACELVDVDLSYTRLLGSDLAGEFQGCDLAGLTARTIAVSGTWTRCGMTEMFLPEVRDAVAWVLVDCHGEGVRLPSASLDSLEMLDCRFPGFVADSADLSRSFIVGTDLAGASLQGANLSGADLERVSLVGADLRGATLSGASFTDVDLTEARVDHDAMDALRSSGPNRHAP